MERRATDTDHAMILLRRECKTAVVRRSCSLACWILALGLMLGSLAASGHGHGPAMPALAVGLVAVVVSLVLLPQSYSPALNMLKQARDVRIAGALLEARDILPHGGAHSIENLLIELLPCMNPADALRLSAGQRRKLFEILALGDASRQERYLLAVLHAVEQIGDEEALRHVRRLVERGAATEAQRRVCHTAAGCCTRIEAGLADHRSHAQLLRAPASAVDTSVLLRAEGKVDSLAGPAKAPD